MNATSSLVGATDWIVGVLLGPLATGVAVLAVAAIGALALSGRLPVRRGLTAIGGCFVLFSAATIAHALVGQADPTAATEPIAATPRAAATVPPQPPAAMPYDPYAGASVPTSTSRPGAERGFN